jgi:hypothetical protein
MWNQKKESREKINVILLLLSGFVVPSSWSIYIRYLSGLLAKDDLWFIFPWTEYTEGCWVNVTEELRLGFGHGDEGECDASKPLVSVTDSHQHGGLAKNAMDGLRITALEQLPFILKYEVVQLLVTRHHSRRQEQMRLEHFPIPEKHESQKT